MLGASVDTHLFATKSCHFISDFEGIVSCNSSGVHLLIDEVSFDIMGDRLSQLSFGLYNMSGTSSHFLLESSSSLVMFMRCWSPFVLSNWCASCGTSAIFISSPSWLWETVCRSPAFTWLFLSIWTISWEAWSNGLSQAVFVDLSITVTVAGVIRELLDKTESFAGESLLLLSESPSCTMTCLVQSSNKLLSLWSLGLCLEPVAPCLVVLTNLAVVDVNVDVSWLGGVVVLELG